MKKILLALSALMIFCAIPVFSQAETTKHSGPYLFKGGNVKILVPPPTNAFIEVGYANDGFLRELVHGEKLSKGYFALKADYNETMDRLNNLHIVPSNSSVFARIFVQEEVLNFNAEDFKTTVDNTKIEIGDSVASNVKESKEMFLKRVDSLGVYSDQLDTRTSLGRLFSKSNAYGYGVLIKDKREDETAYVVAGFAIIRVNDKMLSIYLYAPYKDANTLTWIQKTTERWSDAILASNKTAEFSISSVAVDR